MRENQEGVQRDQADVQDNQERVAVIGLGASGDAAARLALAKGARAYVTDAHVADSVGRDAIAARGVALRDLGADVRLGAHAADEIARADTVVVSPGIPPGAPILAALRARGVDWISEPEFASRFIESPLTIVTGTNGKTTTAALCAHLLCASGVDAALGGNIGGGLGPPASGLALLEPAPERMVIEMSSFQLADIRDLTPDVGVVTNLGVDHMDRYESVEDYHNDKRRLFEAGDERSTWVLNGDDPAVLAMAAPYPGAQLRFSLEGAVVPGAWLEEGRLMADLGDGRGPFRLADALDVRLLGRHNVANALAALLAAVASGGDALLVPGGARSAGGDALLAPGAARSALRSFAPLPHRLEPVGTVGGVRWVNDSKATNVAAAASALSSIEAPVVLLVGGTDKGEDFRGVFASMRGRVRAVVAYGAAGERAAREIGQAAQGAFPVRRVGGPFDEAVGAGQALAHPGDVLLLAPACSSFDMFENYQRRGDAFRALARAGREASA